MDSDTKAIIGGCVAGGVVLVIVLAVTIYIVCGRRKHRKKRHPNKFRQLSPPVSPVHSQPSSLGHNPQARLPKVNSTGLWMGSSAMYSGAPTPAYYVSRGVPVPSKIPNNPRLVPRASSETRIAPPGYAYVQPTHLYSSQSSLFLSKRELPPRPPHRAISMQRVPSQGGQRIFHSQNLTPVYEVPVGNGSMDLYNVYQFGEFSKSKLAETKHTKSYYEDGFILTSKLERSKSDIGEKTKHARRTSEKSRQPSYHIRSSSNEGKKVRSNSRESDNHRTSEHGNSSRGSKSAGSFTEKRAVSRDSSLKSGSSGQNNRAFSADADVGSVYSSIKEEFSTKQSMIYASTKPPVTTSSVAIVATATESPPLMNGTPGIVSVIVDDRKNMDPLATDSMKLLAKNKTDDQKTIVPRTEDRTADKESDHNSSDKKNVGHQHYIYDGDIYAISGKGKFIDGEVGNPIISRMKDMVVEQSRKSNPPSPDKSQSTPDIYRIMHDKPSNVSKESPGRIYEEIKIETKEKVTKEITVTGDAVKEKEQGGHEKLKSTKLAADLSILDGIELPPASEPGIFNPLDIDTSDPVKAKPWQREEQQSTSPIALRVKNTSLKGNDDVDGANDGKRITDSAFEFLNTYLSDDEGPEGPIDSPPLSPLS